MLLGINITKHNGSIVPAYAVVEREVVGARATDGTDTSFILASHRNPDVTWTMYWSLMHTEGSDPVVLYSGNDCAVAVAVLESFQANHDRAMERLAEHYGSSFTPAQVRYDAGQAATTTEKDHS